MDKIKKCLSCQKPSKIKGHKLCQRCYNIAIWKFSDAKSKGKTVHDTFANYIRAQRGLTVTVKESLAGGRVGKKKKSLESDLKAVFHEYIRAKYATPSGMVQCVTCGNWHKWQGTKLMHAGHYLNSGNYPKVRYNEMNVHPQCLSCNYFKSGDEANFRQFLVSKYGEAAIKKMELTAKGVRKYSKTEIDAMKAHYMKLLLIEKKKFKQ